MVAAPHRTDTRALGPLGRDEEHSLMRRLIVLAEALQLPLTGKGDSRERGAAWRVLQDLEPRLQRLDPSTAWLALAVVTAELPTTQMIDELLRAAALDGNAAALAASYRTWRERRSGAGWPDVRVVTGETLLDVHHTASVGYATGIQRVAREVSRRWARRSCVSFVVWCRGDHSLRLLDREDTHSIVEGHRIRGWSGTEVVVPWRCTYVLPELAIEPARTARLQGLAALSGTTLNAIGYDLIPITTAETCLDLSNLFVQGLAATRHARTIAPISNAVAAEFGGWRRMLTGMGLPGPHIEPVVLPSEVPPPDDAQTDRARRRLGVGALPIVLVVGSHEPRKNHVAVLQAAELLWRRGRDFSLTFVGGNAWNSDEFRARVADLAEAGRPVETIAGASDDLLWGAYRAARFTVFPSLNEGFGLPLAESLACGTPAVTSGFGSMREIAERSGGTLLVDPRDDHELAGAIERLLIDEELWRRLRREARSIPRERGWDGYADQLWDVLHAQPGIPQDAEPPGGYREAVASVNGV